MALVLSHEEQEQLDALKAWWRANGRLLIVAVSAALVFSLGWNGWQWWRSEQVQAAAQAFEAIDQALEKQAWAEARAAWERLKAVPWVGKAQAAYAALAIADQAAAKNAAAEAIPVVREAGTLGVDDDAVQPLLAFTLAELHLAQGEYDAAAKALLQAVPAPYQPRLWALKGDIALAQGEAQQAVSHYDKALAEVRGDPSWQMVLRAKREQAAIASDPVKEPTQ